MSLTAVNPFHYRARFEGKTIAIHLQSLRLAPPSKCRLLPDEAFVGPCFDESGLYFSLLFDHARCAFLWLLDDDSPVAEAFVPLGQTLIRGVRTGFVFYDDKARGRRALVGVSRRAVRANSFYDGPFDQLPDNYIGTGEVELRSYIERANPDRRGQIDRLGYFHMIPQSRVAIAPYLRYRRLDDCAALDDYLVENRMPPLFPSG